MGGCPYLTFPVGMAGEPPIQSGEMRAQQAAALRFRARRRRTVRGRTVTTLLAVAGIIASASGVEALDRYDYYVSDLPDPSTLNPLSLPQTSQILDRNGKLLYLQHGAEIRTVVPLAQISPLLRKATIDLEDKNFYEHHGVDYGRLIGAAYADVQGAPVQGGSTITQQLVKRKYLTPERSYDRKIKEALLASEIEDRYSKDDILAAYLNSIFYGHESYGIEAASVRYFSKHASELNLAEATLLAGIPVSPSVLDPLTPEGIELCRKRQGVVLDAMVAQGDVKPGEAAAIRSTPMVLHPQPPDQAFFAPHFVSYVIQYLRERYGKTLVDSGGLRIKTSLDLDLQQKAEAIVRNEVGRFGSSGVNNGAMLALNPTTGEILAYVGSADYNNDAIDGKFDNVTNPGTTGRQPGSSFKPYVYLTALSNGYTPSSIVEDRQGTIAGTPFHDFDNRSEGMITMRKALVESRNIPAILYLRELGFGRVFQTARSLGITTPLYPGLGTAIGASEVHMLEHASAYGVFATEGIYRPATPILEIQDSHGATLFKLGDTGRRVASPQATYLLNDILNGYAKQWNLGLSGPAAGKSGTTDTGADLWYMGYTPDLVVASWMAHTGRGADGRPIGLYPLPGLFGVTTSAYIFKDFLPVYYGSRKIPEFAKPPEVLGGTECTQPQPLPLPSPFAELFPKLPPRCMTTDLHIAGTSAPPPVRF